MRGRLAFALAAAATGWCTVLIVGAFVFPAYSGSACRTTPEGSLECVSETATDFEMNGWWVVGLRGAVALVALLIFLALHRVCTTGSAAAGTAAWAGIALLLVFSYLTGFTVGFLTFPAALALVLAAVMTPKPVVLAR